MMTVGKVTLAKDLPGLWREQARRLNVTDKRSTAVYLDLASQLEAALKEQAKTWREKRRYVQALYGEALNDCADGLASE